MLGTARTLHQAGFATVLFDFRAQGESRGNLCTFGYLEALDVRGAVRYLQERPDTAGLPIAGLGLSIAQEIVTRMGGQISAVSEFGAGSIFTVTLPIEMLS